MKRKHGKKTNLPTGSGYPKRSFSNSSSASSANRHNKKAKHTTNHNQKKENHDAATSLGDQAKTTLTAAQFYNRNDVAPATNTLDKSGITSKKQEKSGAAPIEQETALSSTILPKKLKEIDSSSDDSTSDSDDDVEMNNKAKIEKVLSSEGGKNCSGADKPVAAEAGDECEDADISSEESSVKQHFSAASTPGLSNGPKALLPLFNTNIKPCSPSVEVAPSVFSSANPGSITGFIGKATGESTLRESVKFEMRQDLKTSSIVQIPVWFSQKVRKILEGSNYPDTMKSKDINRLTHYRAWLEGVRHRRWQRYNLADEKRSRLTDLLLKYKVEGRNMEAYNHRFLQRGIWKRSALRVFKTLEKLVKGIKLLDDTLDTIFAEKRKAARKWNSMQIIARASEKRHSMI